MADAAGQPALLAGREPPRLDQLGEWPLLCPDDPWPRWFELHGGRAPTRYAATFSDSETLQRATLKTREFRLLTRSRTPDVAPRSAAELTALALALREQVHLPASTLYRLVGVGLSNFYDPDDTPAQSDMFEG